MWRFRQSLSGRVSDKLRSMISDESFRKHEGENTDHEGQDPAITAGSAAMEEINRNLPSGWWEMICDAAAERLAGFDAFGSKRRRRRTRARDDYYAAAFSTTDPSVAADRVRLRQARYHHDEQMKLATVNFWWLLLFAFLGIVLTIVNILLTHF